LIINQLSAKIIINLDQIKQKTDEIPINHDEREEKPDEIVTCR